MCWIPTMHCNKSNEHKVGVAINARHDRESFDKNLLPVVERKMPWPLESGREAGGCMAARRRYGAHR